MRLAGSQLEDGEPILVWARARQPRTGVVAFQRTGFAYVTPLKFLVRWSGQSDGHAAIPWAEITAWGVNGAAPGGPILGVKAGEDVVYVQLPTRSRLSAQSTAQLLRAFAERAPEVRTELSEHPRHGKFEPVREVSVSPLRRSLAGHTKRLVITIAGSLLVVLAVIIIPLPGPWSILLTIVGLALLASEYDWAEDALHWMREKYRWTREKLRERRAADHDDVPIGAVVVRGGELLAVARNERELRGDPTAHAEILALRAAAEKLGTWRLDGATVYVTLEPCAMCAGAMVLARIERLVYGAADPKAGAAYSLYNIPQDPRLNHTLEITVGVLAADCAALLRDFFGGRR